MKAAEEKTRGRDKLTPKELERRHLCLQKLRDSGEYERIQSNLYAQLMLNETWGTSMQQKVREVVQQGGGISEITLDELVVNLSSHSSSIRVPESIKEDAIEQIRAACEFDNKPTSD